MTFLTPLKIIHFMNGYKIVRIAGLHSKAAIASLYSKNPKLACSPYAVQQQTIFENAYMYSNTFSKEMRRLGYLAEEIVYDVEPLQKMWMQEQGSPFIRQNWQTQVILLQLAYIQPDIVFFQDIHSLPYEARASLKEQIPSIKKIIIFRGFPGIDHKLFKELALADLLLVGSPLLIDKCRKQGLKPHLLYHYFDTSILEKLPPSSINHKIDFSFVGSSGYGYEAHKDRYEMLLTLLKQTRIQLWIDEPHEKQTLRGFIASSIKSFLACCSLECLETLNRNSFWPAKLQKLFMEEIERKRSEHKSPITKTSIKPLSQLFPDRCHPPVFGLEMFRMLQKSRIVLNRHSVPAQGAVDNIRLFQATGVGTCLLTDTGSNMSDLFEVDREIVTYSTFDECLEKTKYLLEHENLRNQIAKAGQHRTLKDHTAATRFQQVHHLIEEMM